MGLDRINPEDLPPLPFEELAPDTAPDGIVLCAFGLGSAGWDLVGRIALVMDPEVGGMVVREVPSLALASGASALLRVGGYKVQALAAFDGDDGQPLPIPDEAQEALVDLIQGQLTKLVQAIATQN